MKLTKKILSMTLAAAMTAGALAGCGGSQSAPTTAAPTQAAAGEAATEASGSKDTQPAATETAKEAPGAAEAGGSLVIAIPQTHGTFFMPQSTSTLQI